MLLSLRWLNKLFPSGLSVEEVVEALERAGLEVESRQDLGLGSGKVVAARVLEVERHPNADRLHLVKADIGAEKPAEIVCGATNLRVGMIVPCATPGAKLPGGVEIRKSKIRGANSEGMLCSAKELNFGADHDGIMELPESWKPGEPFDCILEIKITPNRPDCLSVMGVAREIAAMTGKKVHPVAPRLSETVQEAAQALDISVPARAACGRYACRYFQGVSIGPSPLEARRRLEASGQRPINNVVDATNLAMLELGHPLHAFDYDRIRGGKIIVRFARESETLETLDGRTIVLHPDDLVIADAERPIALAGIMGGKESEVTSATTNVALECAHFDPATIRRAARRHGFSTEASYRFERGTDRQKLHLALNRAAQLIHETAGGEIAKGFIDIHHPPASDEAAIRLDRARVNGLLGLDLTMTEIADRLVNLGFELRHSERESILVSAPSYRVDIERDVDLIEEVARTLGYDRIPETMPAIAGQPVRPGDLQRGQIRRVRALLADLGYDEAQSYSFVSREILALHGFDPAAQPTIANPLSQDQIVMRPALLPELLRAAALNQKQGAERVALFEIGKVFKPGAKAGAPEDESLHLALVLAGEEPAQWHGPARKFDFYDLKGAHEALADELGAEGVRFGDGEAGKALHPSRLASYRVGGGSLGNLGELHPNLAEAHELRGRVYAAEIDLGSLLAAAGAARAKFEPLPKFQASRRDIAVLVDESAKAEDLLAIARKAGGALVHESRLVDLYRGEKIPAGKKSIAMHFVVQSGEKTLTDEEISGAVEKIVKALEAEAGAALRS